MPHTSANSGLSGAPIHGNTLSPWARPPQRASTLALVLKLVGVFVIVCATVWGLIALKGGTIGAWNDSVIAPAPRTSDPAHRPASQGATQARTATPGRTALDGGTLGLRDGSAIEAATRAFGEALRPSVTVAVDASNAVARGLLNPIGEDFTKNAAKQWVTTWHLAPSGLKLTPNPNCDNYVDLIAATGRMDYANSTARQAALQDAVSKAHRAGCVAQMTPRDWVPAHLWVKYERKRAQLRNSTTCAPHVQRLDQFMQSNYTPAQLEQGLALLLVQAQEASCYR